CSQHQCGMDVLVLRKKVGGVAPADGTQLRRLFWPPFCPASEARCGSFLKLPPLCWPPFLPASEARLGSFAKLPFPPRCCSVISYLPFRLSTEFDNELL